MKRALIALMLMPVLVAVGAVIASDYWGEKTSCYGYFRSSAAAQRAVDSAEEAGIDARFDVEVLQLKPGLVADAFDKDGPATTDFVSEVGRVVESAGGKFHGRGSCDEYSRGD